MEPTGQPGAARYAILFVLILLAGFAIRALLGNSLGQSFQTVNPCPGGCLPTPTEVGPCLGECLPTPTEAGPCLGECLPTPTEAGPCVGECLPTPTEASPGQTFIQIDPLLQQATSASFAFNTPSDMQLGQTVTIQLLLSPSASPDQLSTQVSGGENVVSGSLQIAPLMKAELVPQDTEAFKITALPENAEQVVSTTDTTKWEWIITALKAGRQHLTLVVYRQVKYQGQDFWRDVKSYQSDIAIDVTLLQRIQDMDWGWAGGVLVTALLIPGFWRWLDGRKAKRKHS